MLWGNRIKDQVKVEIFRQIIKNYGYEDIKCTRHTFFRLSQEQRELFTCNTIREYLIGETPHLIGLQNNGNHAVFYKYQKQIYKNHGGYKASHGGCGDILHNRKGTATGDKMTVKRKELIGKGEFDYDYANDILFFKVKNREYEKSIELNNQVIDIDDKGFVVGIQIFDVSKFLNITKYALMNAVRWRFQATTEKINENNSRIEVRLEFQVKLRNKIVQPNPIITENVKDSLEDSKMVAVLA